MPAGTKVPGRAKCLPNGICAGEKPGGWRGFLGIPQSALPRIPGHFKPARLHVFGHFIGVFLSPFIYSFFPPVLRTADDVEAVGVAVFFHLDKCCLVLVLQKESPCRLLWFQALCTWD